MSKFTIVECHSLTNNNVKERINSYLNNIILENQGIVDKAYISWNGNNGFIIFKAAGMNFSGNIKVEDEFITISGELPPIAADYFDQLEEIVRYKVFKLLN